MFCTHCGVSLGESEPNFCPNCGKATGAKTFGSARPYQKRLRRAREGRQIAGVCAGLANYFDTDVTLIRLVAVIALLFTAGMAAVGYVIAMAVIPEDPLEPEGSRAPA